MEQIDYSYNLLLASTYKSTKVKSEIWTWIDTNSKSPAWNILETLILKHNPKVLFPQEMVFNEIVPLPPLKMKLQKI